MKKNFFLFFFFLSFCLLIGCKKDATDITFVGLGSDGQEISGQMPLKIFRQYNSQAIQYANEEVQQALLGLAQNETVSWALEAIEVGLTTKVGMGIGDALKVEADLPFILIYKKRK